MRTVNEWREIIGKNSLQGLAEFVLKDLTHYKNGCTFENDDRQQIENLLTAVRLVVSSTDYAKTVQRTKAKKAPK